MLGPLAVGAMGTFDDSGEYYLAFGRCVQASRSSQTFKGRFKHKGVFDYVNEF
ncbi:MAG: hypothetical protein JJ871_04355 [Thalassospira sp.]|uniref:hypothetical protein n=1 Tax=Thalassospira sp. TaxID=1912094 RepID=UPI001B1BC743|nr:hypothetical protein [Thalassospira sp.]MBO6580307.1 hypothetical protein [Thalassospira sp.]MBO6803500.1 hypothetical protein [Thalassospira sp.]MBO6817625.1 hypothetical protein [Thalassospira sp.]MBO6887277.1 hypothetical protein [Thalassospira sp.]